MELLFWFCQVARPQRPEPRQLMPRARGPRVPAEMREGAVRAKRPVRMVEVSILFVELRYWVGCFTLMVVEDR